MFDSALDHVDPTRCATVGLIPGAYEVTAEEYKKDGAFHFLIHRLRRV